MNRCEFSAEAEADLNQIEAYIALDNEAAAASFVDSIEAKCYQIAESPSRGRVFPGGRDTRVLVFHSYLIMVLTSLVSRNQLELA